MIKLIPGRIRSSKLVAVGSLLLIAASLLVNMSNFAFHVIVSRKLDPSSYGALGALLGLLLLFAVPASALQVVITKEVSNRRDSLDNNMRVPVFVGPLLAESLIWGLAVMLLLFVTGPLIERFLHLDAYSTVVLFAIYIIPSVLGLVPKAVLLGELRFGRVAAALVAGAFARLAMAVLFTDTRGLNGALAATVVGEIVGVMVMLPALRPLIAFRAGAEQLRVHWHDGTASIFAFSGFWALTGVDTLLARHYLSRDTSGFYAAAATAARTAMFLPAAITLVALPHFARRHGRAPEARSVLMHSLSAVAVLSIGAALFIAVEPHLVINALFGGEYKPAEAVVGLLAFGAAAMGIVNVLMQFHLASNSRLAAGLPWLGVAAAAIGITFAHDSMRSIAIVMLIVPIALCAWMGQIAFGKGEPEVRNLHGLSDELWETPEATLDLTMVVPYFNPGEAAKRTIENLDRVLTKMELTYEIIAVSDGSTDGSDLLIEQLELEHLRHVVLEKNAGKGQAVRTGLAMGHGRYLGFIDADGDVDPSLLEQYIALVRLYQPDIILGSKRHPMSEVNYPMLRHVYSIGYQVVTYVLFHTKVRDTQTGLKLVRREALMAALPRMVEKRFAFDLELLVVSKNLGFSKFFEAPIKIQHQFKSTVSFKSVYLTAADTLGIFYRLRMLRSYDAVKEISSMQDADSTASESNLSHS